MKKPNSLYIHIPFCEHICGYCDFVKLLYRDDFASSYVFSLIEEIKSLNLSNLKTIYIGGGTPTCLPSSLLKEVLSVCQPLLSKDYEFSVEGNPESLSEEKVALLARFGVNRVSIGMQSSHDERLKSLGRHHSLKDVISAVSLLRKHGIDNINVDLMYALPNEDSQELEEDLKAVLSLKTPHISAYSLILEDDSIFKHQNVKEAPSEVQADQYELILKTLRENGYERYEVSNFAKDGKYSKHNLTYWKDEGYYAAGLGASGYVDGIRFKNYVSLPRYLKERNKRESEEKETTTDELESYFLTNLRLSKGFSLSEFKARFGFPFLCKYQEKCDKLAARGLLNVTAERVYPTDQGLLLLDEILVELF